MRILLNGRQHEIADAASVGDLLKQLQLEGRIAVELNENIVPRSQHQQTTLKADDRVEIVQAIGGG